MGIYRGDGGTGTGNQADVAEIVGYRDEAQAAAASATASASTASTSATTAVAAKDAAVIAQTGAEAAYDSFDDRYLGPKASDPTLDNDGNALLEGALYWSTSAKLMKAYDGASWSFAYAPSGIYLVKTNNLSDLSDASVARTNLGVAIGSDVQAYDANTAKLNQAANFTSTLQRSGSNVLVATDIGSTVQGYDANTAKLNAAANFTSTLQRSGSNVLVSTDIGSSVQAYSANIAFINTAQTFSASQRGTVTTDNDLSFDLNVTNNFKCTPTAGGTLTFTNIAAGQSGFILMVNGSNYAIAAAATTKISAANLALISATGTYILSYFSDGTNVYVSAGATA